MTQERIEAEVAAETKRIQAWNDEPTLRTVAGSWLRPNAVESLANHLVRNRLQADAAKDAQHKRLVEAARALTSHIWTERFCISHAGCSTYNDLVAALKAEEEA